MKKYELTNETMKFRRRTLYRIRALRDFSNVKAGDLGGWVESENNLSHDGDCWVFESAKVCECGTISGDGEVYGYGEVCGYGKVYGDGKVYEYSRVYGNGVIENQNDIITISNLGSRNATTTFFKDKDNRIMVACGCFEGDIDEFLAAVEKKHGDSQHGRMYRMAVEMAKAQIYGNNNR